MLNETTEANQNFSLKNRKKKSKYARHPFSQQEIRTTKQIKSNLTRKKKCCMCGGRYAPELCPFQWDEIITDHESKRQEFFFSKKSDHHGHVHVARSTYTHPRQSISTAQKNPKAVPSYRAWNNTGRKKKITSSPTNEGLNTSIAITKRDDLQTTKTHPHPTCLGWIPPKKNVSTQVSDILKLRSWSVIQYRPKPKINISSLGGGMCTSIGNAQRVSLA